MDLNQYLNRQVLVNAGTTGTVFKGKALAFDNSHTLPRISLRDCARRNGDAWVHLGDLHGIRVESIAFDPDFLPRASLPGPGPSPQGFIGATVLVRGDTLHYYGTLTSLEETHLMLDDARIVTYTDIKSGVFSEHGKVEGPMCLPMARVLSFGPTTFQLAKSAK